MKALADLLEIWGFQDDAILFADSSMGFVLEVDPVDVSCWEDSRIDNLASRVGSLLNSLPTGIDLQFVQELGNDSSAILHRSAALRLPGVSPSVTALHEGRLSWLRARDEAGEIPRHSIKLFVRRAGTPSDLSPKWFTKTRVFEALTTEYLEREIKALFHLREELLRGLKALDLRARPLVEAEIASDIYHLWNPCRAVELGEYDPEDVRSSLLFTDAGINERGFTLGDVHHRIVSLKLLPDQTFASMSRSLRHLPLDSKLFVTVHVPNQQKELEALQTQRRIAFSMARGKKSGAADLESEAKFQDLEVLISDLVAQGERIFHLSLNILLRSRSARELDEQVAIALAGLRELSGAEGMEESLAAFDIFTELAPPNARSKERSKRVKTSNAADFLPVFGSWTGHEIPRTLLRTEEGALIGFDPFSKDLANYNQIVTGGSGSGKSFLTNLLLLQVLKENPKVFIVDIGGSYKRLCETLDGQYIPFDLSGPLSLNPFDLAPGESLPSSQKIKFLVGLVEMMTKEEGDLGLARLERAEIEEAIQSLYGSTELPHLSHLRDRLLSHSDASIRKFGKILGPWCGDTPYGRLVDRPTNVAMERGLVSFDLKGLDAYPDLQSVVLYLITDYVWRSVQQDRSTMKFLVFDECWKLLEAPAGSAFIGEVFRTFRKYYASAVAISQNIDDFAKSRVAGAILPNTSVKWVLMQKGADKERLKEVLHLNDTEIALIGSLHQERGRYSQAFLMAEDRHCLVTIEPTPLEYWMATTDPRDLARLEVTQRSHPGRSSLEVLKQLATELPRGVVATEGAR